MSQKKLTPMMLQYRHLKKQHPDKFLFFRLGDFYELFEEDALEAAKILQITLTKRNDIPMCGIPHHQLTNYAHKMISLGKKIAIAEQLEITSSEKENRTIVERKVTNIITPGTTIDEMNLESKAKNFIMTFLPIKQELEKGTILALDISTNETWIQLVEHDLASELHRFFLIYRPKEMMIELDLSDHSLVKQLRENYPHLLINPVSRSHDPGEVSRKVRAVFQNDDWLKSVPESYQFDVFRGIDLLITYLETNYGQHFHQLKSPEIMTSNYLILDQQTLTQLEIFSNTYDQTKAHSLIDLLDHTLTPMGGRLLKEWLARPPIDRFLIEERLDRVEWLYREPHALEQVRNLLKQIYDTERLVAKIVLKKILPRELINLKKSLVMTEKLNLLIQEKMVEYPQLFFRIKEVGFDLETIFSPVKKVIELIQETLLVEPANDLKEGGVICPTKDLKLNEYYEIKQNGEHRLLELEQREKSQTQITSLKIKFNENLGYFFEVRQSSASKVPEYFKRRQTLTNVDRFVSEELMALEQKILEARKNSFLLEKDIYEDLKQELICFVPPIQQLSHWVGYLDVIANLAQVALTHRYKRPQLHLEEIIQIKGGRHPVVEKNLEQDFIPNDIEIGSPENMIHIITGPNMSGKSTFLRQAGLICLMAQLGSFVPVESAYLPVLDRIFTRIGSADRLTKGESTFFVEMNETANILKNATKRSLIIMDEIGRGTSTYDGLAIAWSILEYLSHRPFGIKTLFATHYHELARLSEQKKIKLFQVEVKDDEKDILFLKKVKPGVTERSYGIHVARIAGVPKEVSERADQILQALENGTDQRWTSFKQSRSSDQSKTEDHHREWKWFKEKLSGYNINEITPLQALNILDQWISRVKKMK